jgi:hypothetical protein
VDRTRDQGLSAARGAQSDAFPDGGKGDDPRSLGGAIEGGFGDPSHPFVREGNLADPTQHDHLEVGVLGQDL